MIRRETVGPEAAYERFGSQIYRDTTSGFTKLRDTLKGGFSGFALLAAAVSGFCAPATIDAVLPISASYAAWVLTRRVVLPLRLPAGAKRRDYNYPDPKTRRARKAAGIFYLGQDYRTGQQLWISNDDARQHAVVPGTTGAGKTVGLVSLAANALTHGSGFIFVDGKADNGLYAQILALARRFGREDDVLALNFLVASGNKDTHTFNPFAWGNADVIRELLVSQIEAKPGGSDGNKVFMDRAISLLGALTPCLVWMRDNRGIPIDIEKIRYATELGSIASLAIDHKFPTLDVKSATVALIDIKDAMPEELLYPLRAYLGETGGYDFSLPHNKQKTDEPAKQHNFATMHFSATFTQLAVSLGHIFKCEVGDIDLRDVVLNRRILVVNLPSLENGGETTAALGKIVVASLRNMMAQTLGASLDGDYQEIVANKASMAPSPFPVIFDECAYYLPAGADKMLAMGRGLGFQFLLGFQEVPGLVARIGQSVYSLLGNANLQILMRLQEGGETRRYVEQTAGDTHVTQASGFKADAGGNYRDGMHADVRQINRVNWNDLRNLIEGEAIVLFGKQRIYTKLFTAMPDPDGMMHVTRSLTLPPPPAQALRDEQRRMEAIKSRILKGMALDHAEERSAGPVVDALLTGFGSSLREGRSIEDSAMAAVISIPAAVLRPMTEPQRMSDTTEPDEVGPHEFDDMLSPTKVIVFKAAPIAIPSKASQSLIAQLSAIEEMMGNAPVDARMAALLAVGEREEASNSRLPKPLIMADEVLCGHIDKLIVALQQPHANREAP